MKKRGFVHGLFELLVMEEQDAQDEMEQLIHRLQDLRIAVRNLDCESPVNPPPKLNVDPERAAAAIKCQQFFHDEFRIPGVMNVRRWVKLSLETDDQSDSDYDPAEDSDEDSGTDTSESTPNESASTEGDPTCSCQSRCKDQFTSQELRRISAMLKGKRRCQRRQIVQNMMLAFSHVQRLAPAALESGSKRRQRKTTTVEISEPRRPYLLGGAPVCRSFFISVVDGRKRLIENVKRDFKQGIYFHSPDFRGLDSFQTERQLRALTFLHWFADCEGLPNPDGRGATKDQAVIQLPISTTRKVVWEKYRENMPKPHFSYSYFIRLWKEHLPFLRLTRPKTDFCDKCFNLRAQAIIDELKLHLELVKKQREFNRSELVRAMLSYELSDTAMHITYWSSDYSQSFRIPRCNIQPAHYYFMSGLVVDILGVVDEMRMQQDNYLFVEGVWPGAKDANSILSVWYHRLLTDSEAKASREVIMITDNCVGQFKNCYVVWFLAWWVIVGTKYGSANCIIKYHFNIVGHTKFAPDRGFAVWRNASSRFAIYTPQDLFNVIEQSSCMNRAECTSSLTCYNFKDYLQQFFHFKIPGITRMHHFVFDSSKPGVVSYQEYPDSPMASINLFSRGITAHHILHPDGESTFDLVHRNFDMRITHPPMLPTKRVEDLQEIATKYPGRVIYTGLTSCCR